MLQVQSFDSQTALCCPHGHRACQNQQICLACVQVMLFAVQNPALQNYQLETHVKPAISSLKAAGVDVTDIWFLVTKRLDIFAEPISLQVSLWVDTTRVHAESKLRCT